MSGTCLIAPNPDVAGIGVRIAIYAQNFLGFFPALVALQDKHVDEVELDALEAQSTTILIMALAILVTTIVEAAKNDFINYHTSIVLSLSWINNTNTFLYFLLWLHRKTTLSQERHNEATYSNEIEISVESPSISEHSAFTIEEERKVFDAKRELSSRLSQPVGIGNMGWWLDTLWTSLNTLARGEKRAVALSNANRGIDTIVNKEDTLLRQAQVTFQNTIDDVYASFHRLNAVFLLGSIHLTLMSAVEIWLWHSPTSFGASPPCSSAKQINLLGHPVHIGSLPLQIISLIMYSIFLVPFLNLVLPMAAITSLYIFCNRSRVRSMHRPHIYPISIGLVLLLVISVIFIVDIELTIQRNDDHQPNSEQSWSFGQILPLVLLLIPLRDVFEIITGKRDRLRQEVLNEAVLNILDGQDALQDLVLKGARPDLSGSNHLSVLHFAVDQSDEYLLRSLLTKGRVSPNFQDLRPSVLPLAVQRDLPSDFIEMLVEHGADVNHPGIIDKQKTTALMEAALHRRWGIYEYLVEHGADVNSPNAEHGSPFAYVVRCGYEQMAQMSLSHGAGVNLPVAPYQTALIAAANARQWKMVQWLLERGADTLPTSQQFGTALTQASWHGDLSTVKLLLQHQADVNGDGGLYGSALIAAASESHWDIVEDLLEKGADPETTSTFYGSTLIQAARHGNIVIAELLCTFGVLPSKDGTSGPYSQGFPTPLMAATYYNHIDMVVWLVDHGADVNRIAQHSGKAGNTPKTALDMTDENLGAIDGSKNIRDGGSIDVVLGQMQEQQSSGSLDSLTTDGAATTADHNSGEQLRQRIIRYLIGKGAKKGAQIPHSAKPQNYQGNILSPDHLRPVAEDEITNQIDDPTNGSMRAVASTSALKDSSRQSSALSQTKNSSPQNPSTLPGLPNFLTPSASLLHFPEDVEEEDIPDIEVDPPTPPTD